METSFLTFVQKIMTVEVSMASSASAATSSGPVYELPWYVWVETIKISKVFNETWPVAVFRVEKYRPLVLDDIVGNQEVVERLAIIAKEGNMPNIILAGPPGIGKTTTILCLARELLGAQVYKDAVLELNASDDRGIDVVRNKIKMFAQKKVTLPPGRHKIIILDEADR